MIMIKIDLLLYLLFLSEILLEMNWSFSGSSRYDSKHLLNTPYSRVDITTMNNERKKGC